MNAAELLGERGHALAVTVRLPRHCAEADTGGSSPQIGGWIEVAGGEFKDARLVQHAGEIRG